MPPKLRASCDTCHSAKIKCIKTDTGCQRCDNSAGDLACKYSPAVPRVYHKKSNPNRLEESQIPLPITSSESALLHDSYGTQVAFNQDIYAAAAAPPSTFDEQIYGVGANAEPNSFFWQYLPQSSIGVPPCPNLWPSNIDSESTTTTTPVLTNAATPTTAGSTTSGSNKANFGHYPLAPPSASSQGMAFSRAPCECFAHLLEAMQHMNIHTTSRNPKLDAVLSANQTAVKHCLTSLQCSDSQTISHDYLNSCATIACGLLDRVLSSYQAALEVFCANLDSEGENRLGEHGEERIGEHENNEDDEERMTARATTVQLRIGSFALERSDQVLWAREIVAREAGKVQETLKGFGSEGQGARSVLLNHLSERYKRVISEVSGS